MKRSKFAATLLAVFVMLALTVSSVLAEAPLPPADQGGEPPAEEASGISVDALPLPRSPSYNQ